MRGAGFSLRGSLVVPFEACPRRPRCASRIPRAQLELPEPPPGSVLPPWMQADRHGMVRRRAAAAVLAFALAAGPGLARAAGDSVETVYFGNGCFWGRQKDFVDKELALGRGRGDVSAVVGYAGGQKAGPNGHVCYYTGPRASVYERLGHAEVVQLELKGTDEAAREQMAAFADVYFAQFQKTRQGMQRLDPQDAGPGYRNVLGIPGGVHSHLFDVLKERNVNGMRLVEGQGSPGGRRPLEPDLVNTVYVYDSEQLPFYAAEQYHQFHDGIGKPFPGWYKRDQKAAAMAAGRIGPTGCPESSFF